MMNVIRHLFWFDRMANVMALACLALCLSAVSAHAQVPRTDVHTPLHICSKQAIEDEFGVKLRGRSSSPGDVVQVLWATNGIYPPEVDGTPNPNNPPVEGAATGIGALIAPGLVDEGIFSISIAQSRPGDGAEIFVRTFNAPDLSGASFYGDSQILTVEGDNVLRADIGATSIPLDPADTDNDGLNNSWEESYGSDPNDPDTDDDGMVDGHEVRAGTGLLDPDSNLAVLEMITFVANDVYLEWSSIIGKQYQVQHTDNDLAQNPQWTNVSAVIDAAAGVDVTTTTITNGTQFGTGHFRIGLVE